MASQPSILRSSPKLAFAHGKFIAIALRTIYVLGVSAILFLWLRNWGYDDPYITYRYAENLARGAGFVYNLGEQVQSTTTPLFAILLAALSPLPLGLPSLANLIGAVSLALGGCCMYELAQAWKTPLVGWAGLAFYPFFPLLLSTLGSETPLYLALGIASFLFYARRSYTLTAVCAALATLARPDGILVPALLGLHYVFSIYTARHTTPWPALARQIPWRAVLIFLALLASWFLFAWAYYGSPLPVTLAAKQSQGTMAISQRFAAGFVQVVRDHAAWPQYQVLGVLAAIGLFAAGWRARAWTLFLAWTAAYFAAYTALGVSRYYWYYAPLVPGFIVLAGLGLQGLWQGFAWIIQTRLPGNQKTDRIRFGWKVVTLAALLALTLGISALLARSAWGLGQRIDPRLEAYRATGQWLDEHTPLEAQVSALEIGIIGYYANRPIIDFAGLLQPETMRQLRPETTYDDAARWAVQRYRPEFVVVQVNSLPGLELDLQAEGCTVAASIPATGFGTRQPLWIYACSTNR